MFGNVDAFIIHGPARLVSGEVGRNPSRHGRGTQRKPGIFHGVPIEDDQECGTKQVPSGKLTVCYWRLPFIVDFLIKKGGFSIVMLVYQRVEDKLWCPCALQLLFQFFQLWFGRRPYSWGSRSFVCLIGGCHVAMGQNLVPQNWVVHHRDQCVVPYLWDNNNIIRPILVRQFRESSRTNVHPQLIHQLVLQISSDKQCPVDPLVDG